MRTASTSVLPLLNKERQVCISVHMSINYMKNRLLDFSGNLNRDPHPGI